MKRLSVRELNRALLARQMLLERERRGVVDAVERLGGLQAQWPPSPYLSLWTRLDGFAIDDLSRLIRKGEVLKASLHRTTLHLVSAREYPAYSTVTAGRRASSLTPPGQKIVVQLKPLHERVLAFATSPRTRDEIQEHLEPHMPKGEQVRRYITWTVCSAKSLVLEPGSALWEHRQGARYLTAPAKLRKALPPAVAHDLLVRRYLAAFGPATVADIAAWSGARVPPLREALARIGGVVRFEDEKGRELFDLAKAPRPDPATPAPPRFLPRFDNAILGHAAPERARIMPDRFRSSVVFAAEVRATFLVDGFVAGKWSIEATPAKAVLHLKPFAPIPKAHRDALFAEGERLLRFAEPDSKRHVVKAAGAGVPRRTAARQRWV